jgi:hypothetical protein
MENAASKLYVTDSITVAGSVYFICQANLIHNAGGKLY